MVLKIEFDIDLFKSEFEQNDLFSTVKVKVPISEALKIYSQLSSKLPEDGKFAELLKLGNDYITINRNDLQALLDNMSCDAINIPISTNLTRGKKY